MREFPWGILEKELNSVSSKLNETALIQNVKQGVLGIGRIAKTAQVVGATAVIEGIKWSKGEQTPPPRILRRAFEQLGTTYIKLGQFIASSPSLFPEEYVKEFESCLDKTPALEFAYIQSVIEDELGKPMHDVFEQVDPTPLGSASIAQVHSATLKSGEDVVIKVQKPHARNTILTDLNFLRIAGKLVEWLLPAAKHASVSDVLQQIQTTMLEECDFIQEANNLTQFRAFLAQHNIQNVHSPRVFEQVSTTKVLVMERLRGTPMSQLGDGSFSGQNTSAQIQTALHTWFQSVFMCDFFHADLHAGNLMALDDGRVGFIDFGIVGRIQKDTWKAVMTLMMATHQRDFTQMANAMLNVGMTDDSVNVNALAQDIQTVFEQVDETDSDDINDMLMSIVSVGKRHGIKFPREFALLMKQFLYFDRYLDVLDIDADLFDMNDAGEDDSWFGGLVEKYGLGDALSNVAGNESDAIAIDVIEKTPPTPS